MHRQIWARQCNVDLEPDSEAALVEDVNWTVFFFPARYLRRVGFLESHMQGKLVAWNLNIVYYYHDGTHKGTMFC